ncbi:MAG: DNA recombination protein RmuC [Candidatus Micrarchaeia archaeon]
MDFFEGVLVIISALIFAAFSAAVGYYYGVQTERKRKEYESNSALIHINQQLAEIKIKFEEIEKARKDREKLVSDMNAERIEFMDILRKDASKKEEDRLKQVQEIIDNMGKIERILVGTYSRGKSGEELLKESLKDFIKIRLVECNVSVGNNLTVEYGWKLNDGKYIPIDSKYPDIFGQIRKLDETNDANARKKLKEMIKRTLERNIDDITKYQNQTKTTDYCILSVPDSIIELLPEICHYGLSKRVFVVGYSNTAIIAFLIAQQYNKSLEERDVKELSQIIESLSMILDKISENVSTIERGIKMVKNASEDIQAEVVKGKQKIKLY